VNKLNDTEIAEGITALPDWSIVGGKLHREYRFPDFAHAMGFLMTAAPSIERLDHHPEWSNVYNRVTVDLTTHDAGGITRKDLALAALLECIANKLQ